MGYRFYYKLKQNDLRATNSKDSQGDKVLEFSEEDVTLSFPVCENRSLYTCVLLMYFYGTTIFFMKCFSIAQVMISPPTSLLSRFDAMFVQP